MNLVIDCFKLVKGAGKSIGIYNLTKSMTEHLGKRSLKEQETGQTIIVLGNSYNREDFDVPGVTFIEMKGNPLNKIYCILWELFLVPWHAKKYMADRIVFPRGFRPLICRAGTKKIKDTVVIHDLIPFYYNENYPGVFNKLENAYIMNRLKSSIRWADRIVTGSEYSKEDILEKVPGCGNKITVIQDGLNNVSYEADGEASGKYIVAMTSGLPHKNAKGVLKAYEAYYEEAVDGFELVVIGIENTSIYPEMKNEAAKRVTCYKFFESFQEVCKVAANAKAYLFLSYMEGFGFPPLEAMQLGVPVVCSNRSSLPEVVGNAGILVDPDDIEGVAEALITVTTDEELRKELIAKGYENIKRFSWESRTDLYWEELFQ